MKNNIINLFSRAGYVHTSYEIFYKSNYSLQLSYIFPYAALFIGYELDQSLRKGFNKKLIKDLKNSLIW